MFCKYARKEITIEKLFKGGIQECDEYLEKLKNMKSGVGKTYRNKNGDWCELDIIKHNIDDTIMYFECVSNIKNKKIPKEFVEKSKKIIELCKRKNLKVLVVEYD